MRGNKILAVLSGVLLVITQSLSLFQCIGVILDGFEPEILLWFFAVAILLGVGITLLFGRINVGTVVLFGLYTVVEIVMLIYQWNIWGFREIAQIVELIPTVSALMFFICCTMVFLKKEKVAKVLIVFPIVLEILFVILRVRIGIFDIFVYGAYVLMALYIMSIRPKRTNIENVSNNQNKIPEIGAADKLLQYKELMDAGIISEEEFNEKKNQALGL